jgi:hypothetical protein
MLRILAAVLFSFSKGKFMSLNMHLTTKELSKEVFWIESFCFYNQILTLEKYLEKMFG